MIESLYIAETGMHSQQKLIEVISNNIANASTPGFKQSHVNFVDLVYQPPSSGQQSEVNKSVMEGLGVQVHSTSTNFKVGDFKQTNNAFDIAINGAGFMEVINESGETAYTRSGRLRVNSEGYLTIATGEKLASNIQLPPDTKAFVIASNGSVSVDLGNNNELVNIGQIDLVNFNNPDGLQTVGNNLYMATNTAGNAIYGEPSTGSNGELLQGFTEMSNVSMTEEMVNLMLAQRGYQLNARIIQVSDQVLETINNLRR